MRLTILALLLFSFGVNADLLNGRVVKVTDGDTITVLDNSNIQHKIRLSGIDAPEMNQAYGERSRLALAYAVAGGHVLIDWNKRDRWNRIVGKVLVNNKDINLQQVQEGMAWHYKKYEREQDAADRALYAHAEDEAQRNKIGLWRNHIAVPPWEFRKLAKR